MNENERDVLSLIQCELNAPKNQWNKFGNYRYRSCEDVLEGLKPLLNKYNCSILLADDIQCIGERYYVRAEATLLQGERVIAQSHAYARECVTKPGMDEAQITGSCSSYARKYALNGLLAVDDTRDPDAEDKKPEKDEPKPESAGKKPDGQDDLRTIAIETMKKNKDKEFGTQVVEMCKALKVSVSDGMKEVRKFDNDISKLTEPQQKTVLNAIYMIALEK